MYYETKIIDGILHFRTHPDSTWTAYDAKVLTEMFLTEQQMRKSLSLFIKNIKASLNELGVVKLYKQLDLNIKL